MSTADLSNTVDGLPTLAPRALVMRCARLTGHLAVCIAVMLALPVLRRRVDGLTRWWYGRLLRILNIHVVIKGRPPDQAAVAVSNHISWVDIPLFGSLLYPAFVSKSEVERWPVVGRFARATGTVFLQRGAFRTAEAGQRLRRVLRHHRCVLLFPEATTNADLMPNRFHARLFAAAIEGQYPVQPIAVRYLPEESGTGGHHPLAPWVNEAGLAGHFLRLLRLPSMTVEVTYCPQIEPTGRDRRALADASHAAIAAALASGDAAPTARAG